MWKRLLKLWTIVLPFKRKAFVLLSVMVLAAISEAAGLSMIMPLLNVIIGENPGTSIGKYLGPFLSLFPEGKALVPLTGLLLGLTITKSALQILQDYLSSSLAWRLSEKWYNNIMNYYLYSPFAFILNQKQGVLLNNLIGEPSSAAQSIMRILQLLAKLIMSVCLYGLLWVVDWQVTLILTVIAALIFLMIQGISKKYSESAGKRKIALLQKQNTAAAENIVGMRLIKTFSLESLCSNLFRKINQDLRRLRVKFAVLQGLPRPLGELLIVIGISAILILFSSTSPNGLKDMLPLFGLVALVSQRLLTNVSFLVTQSMNIHFLLPSLSLVHDLANGRDGEESLDNGEEFQGLQGDIVFQGVSFSHEEKRAVFDSLILSIAKGKMTALVGPSGIGKSTIADLLLGLIKPAKGQILVNGKPLDEYSLNSWRKRIGFVSQDTIIFNTSIKENIRFGNLDASEDEVIKAAKSAAIHDFVSSLPEGYDTEVGDRGLKLSGGQRQRVAIARAIIRAPELYIFDEATSSLDNESERLIQKSIEDIGKNKTVLVIAHRLSTIENADVVYDLGQMIGKSGFSEAERYSQCEVAV
jgi:subfamily B ATP-binding cassette protein MsbA